MLLRENKEDISKLVGIGKAIRDSYYSLGVYTFSDLLSLNPRAYEDRSKIIRIGEQGNSGNCNTFIEVQNVSFFGAKHILKVIVQDVYSPGGHSLSLLCFNRNFLKNLLRIGRKFYFYGNVSYSYGQWQSSQFEVIPMKEDGTPPPDFGKILPIYSLSGSLSQRIIRRDVKSVLSQIKHFDNEIPEYLMEKYKLINMDNAIRQWHFPSSLEEIKKARRTLAYSELFYLQLATRRKLVSSQTERKQSVVTSLEESFIKSLPFSLTKDQEKVLSEIRDDMASKSSMNRLLQGDVGSGKTLVAWISALHVISEKKQVAFMAPTELLALQHARNASELFSAFKIRVAVLTGSISSKARKLLLIALKKGEIDILIGTHALFSKNVVFRNLKYIIIDEQQRFGVSQRLALFDKGEAPDVLLMTATPIPRTLALTVFGNLNVSTINSMPIGRLPIVTYLVSNRKRDDMYRSVGVEFARGHQAYFVYPRIEDIKDDGLRDVVSMFTFLKSKFPNVPSALIHSKLSEEEKISILEDFRKGKIKYLVSTSVVEVGIDVADATCMIVEHAQLFGMSALHQLRGRVGRSTIQSWCFLVFDDNLTEDGKNRLRVMKKSNDGFYIAEQDLVIRGPGEITGVKQSGFLHLHYSDLNEDLPIIEKAREDVDKILSYDPGLLVAENSIIRKVLQKAPPFNS